jgi:hypothetical protein
MRLAAALSAVGTTAATIMLAIPARADVDTDVANQLHTYGIYGQRDYSCFSKRFGCGGTLMRRCAVRLRCLFATRTRSATGCVESRNVPADPSRGRRMSPNCVWLSRYIAV